MWVRQLWLASPWYRSGWRVATTEYVPSKEINGTMCNFWLPPKKKTPTVKQESVQTRSDLPAALLHLGGRDWLRSETLAGFTARGSPCWHVASSTPATAIGSCFRWWVWDGIGASTFSTGGRIKKTKKQMTVKDKVNQCYHQFLLPQVLSVKHHQHSGINADVNTFYGLKLVKAHSATGTCDFYHQSWSASSLAPVLHN